MIQGACPIPPRGSGRINPIPHRGSGRNEAPYQEIICLYVFSPDPTPSQVPVTFALAYYIKTSLLSILNFFVFSLI